MRKFSHIILHFLEIHRQQHRAIEDVIDLSDQSGQRTESKEAQNSAGQSERGHED